MTIEELQQALENIEIYYWESGAYYDSDYEAFIDTHHRALESKHHLSLIGG